MHVYDKVRAYIEENKMLQSGDRVIMGISGGGDSMAMLSFLRLYAANRGITLQVVHVHHGIRGTEADRDAAFVENMCRDCHIPCRIFQYPVPALAAEWKKGLEETGRLVRKEAFSAAKEKLQTENGRVRIALAHNQDDLAETMLHNLCRGTGIRGLSAMRPVTDEIIRPILCLTKHEIEEYLRTEGIPYILDSSNLSEAYTRNRIRRNILPLLKEQVNLETTAHMAAASGFLAAAGDYLFEQGKLLLERFGRKNGEGYFLEKDFFAQEPAILPYALMIVLGELSGTQQDFAAVHVEDILRLIGRQTGRRVKLPYGISAVRTYGGIQLLRTQESQKSEGFCAAGERMKSIPSKCTAGWELSVPGKLGSPLGTVETRSFVYSGQKIEEKKYTKWLDYDKIVYPLFIRTRKTGDYLVVRSDGSKKKLGRLFIDEKVPREQRERIPLVASGEEILWVIGGRISEKYKITSDTRRVLEIRYEGGA